MNSQHCLVASQSRSFPLACSPSNQSSIRCHPVSSSSPAPRAPAASASFSVYRRHQRCSGADSWRGLGSRESESTSKRWWEVSQPWLQQQQRPPLQGSIRVLLRKHQLRTRPRSQADTEADSIEDTNLEDINLEDLDSEQLDELFETYGEVVKADSEPTPTSSEADNDAESLAFAVSLAEVANEVKAGEIRVLCVKPLVYWTSFFVIATGFSRPQVDAIGTRMRDMAEERFKRTSRGDLKPNAWTLLDFGDVVVHIFYPKERSYYNLEEFYGNAIPVELPFESQSQMR